MSTVDRGARVAFLEAGAARALLRGSGTLIAHLRGTEAILQRWGAAVEVCDVALFHSIYGTENYGAAALALESRHELRDLIGARAENLACLFGVMEKPAGVMKKAGFYERVGGSRTGLTLVSRLDESAPDVPDDVFADLCQVFTTNCLEQRPRAAAKHQDLRRAEFTAMRQFLSEPARAELDRAYAFTSAE